MAEWNKRPTESRQAYAAFQHYLRESTIDAAYRAAHPRYRNSTAPVPGYWKQWSTDHEWVARAAAYQDHLAEQDRLLWEERRQQMREREWARGDALHALIEEALPHAQRFIHASTQRIEGVNGQPDREVITLSFDLTGLSKVSLDASKLQRLATDEPTDRINLTGAALDAYIARQLARAANGHQAADGDAAGIVYLDSPTAGDAAEAASETT